MKICIHGDIAEICKKRGIVPTEVWTGKLSEYNGICCTVVTDSDISKKEFYELKGEFRARGIELISTRYSDEEPKRIGRQPFGWRVFNGEIVEDAFEIEVALRAIELHDRGLTLRAISEDEDICRPSDGSRLSSGTIYNIIKNRKKYENGK